MGLLSKLMSGRRANIEVAASYLADHRYDEALVEADALLKANKNHGLAHRLRGEVLVALGRHNEAAESFERASELGGDGTEDVFLWTAECYMHAGRFDDAHELLDQFLEAADNMQQAGLIARAQAMRSKIDKLKSIGDKQVNRMHKERSAGIHLGPRDVRLSESRAR